MSTPNSSAIVDVNLLLRTRSCEDVDIILHSLEEERRALERDLNNIVGQHYIKILEASAAVEDMKNTASSIENLLNEGCCATPLAVEFETRPNSNSPLHVTVANDYYQIWNSLEDGLLENSTKLLAKAAHLEDQEAKRIRRVLVSLIDRRLNKVESETIEKLIDATKSKSLLLNLNIESIVEQVYTNYINIAENAKTDCRIISKIIKVGICLGLEGSVFERIIINSKLESCIILQIAVFLYGSAKEQSRFLSSKLFNHWLDQIGRITDVHDLYKLNQQILNSLDSMLPEEWMKILKDRFSNICIPSESQLLFVSLFGGDELEVDDLKTVNSLEEYFVPSSLPRILKL